jgi:hypothetical protein
MRAWIDAHGVTIGELRAGEIRLAMAIDDVRRAADARHADNRDLMHEADDAADSLARLADSALALPKVPDIDGELFFRTACRQWLDAAERVRSATAEGTEAGFDRAVQDLLTGRREFHRALEVLSRAAGSAQMQNWGAL